LESDILALSPQPCMVPTIANLAAGFLPVRFLSRVQVCQLKSYGVSTGLVHVKKIAVFITHVQYLAETFLSNIRRGKLQ